MSYNFGVIVVSILFDFVNIINGVSVINAQGLLEMFTLKTFQLLICHMLIGENRSAYEVEISRY